VKVTIKGKPMDEFAEEIKTKSMMKPTLIEQMIKEMNEKIAER